MSVPSEVNTHSSEIKLNYSFAKHHGVLINNNGEGIEVIYRPNLSPHSLLELRRYLQKPFKLTSVDNEKFIALLGNHYQIQSNSAMEAAENLGEQLELSGVLEHISQIEDLLEEQDDAPIIRLLNAILSEAIRRKASDIHFETFEEGLSVRLRIDGVLHNILQVPIGYSPLVVSRLKIMSKLDISEKRLPQDGRISLRVGGWPVDVRVSTIPTADGERVVLRLLDKHTVQLHLSDLGMSDRYLSIMKGIISKPHGIILVTGPTGAGKTTTLYAMLTELNQPGRNILTVEDPIEYKLQGVGQMQVNNKVNMTFAKGLRAILRQDPDIVMVGEIRDLETAGIAVQASLTGHLVLSTLHTNDAIGAITRLRDMGVESFLLSSSLLGIVAQRLVRLLCEFCKKPYQATIAELEYLGLPEDKELTLYQADQCEHCNFTGYNHRTGIYELIVIDEHLSSLIHENASQHEINKYIRKKLPNMRADGFQRVMDGKTTIEEVLRVTSE